MNNTQKHIHWLDVTAGNRIYLRDSHTPTWITGGATVYLWPLAWVKKLKLPRDMYYHAWAMTPDLDNLLIDQEKSHNNEALDLSDMVFELTIGAKSGSDTLAWGFSIPASHRKLGWFPGKEGVVALRTFDENVELWHGAALEEHNWALSVEWEDRMHR